MAGLLNRLVLLPAMAWQPQQAPWAFELDGPSALVVSTGKAAAAVAGIIAHIGGVLFSAVCNEDALHLQSCLPACNGDGEIIRMLDFRRKTH